MRRHLATNENETTTIQHLGDTGKAIRGKFIELQAYLKQNKTTRKNPPQKAPIKNLQFKNWKKKNKQSSKCV